MNTNDRQKSEFCKTALIAALFFVFALFFSSCDAASVRAAVLPPEPTTRPQGAADAGGGGLQFTEKSPYDKNTVVAVNTAVDVYERADKTSARLTQLLFDEPAQVLERSGQWVRLNTGGRAEGWVRARDLDGDWTCVDGRRYTGRIVITNREKQIYSQPRNGAVIRDISMGTELFVIGKSDNLYQVALPGNLTGWVFENGTFQLDGGEKITKTTAEIFAQSCVKFKGTSYLEGGVGFAGIDGAGLLYIAAKVNGVALPRGLAEQFTSGEAVPVAAVAALVSVESETSAAPEVTEVSEAALAAAIPAATPGSPIAAALKVGDVLFFSLNEGETTVSDIGIYTGEGKFIHANRRNGKVQYEDAAAAYYQQRILGVRRYF
ncbi:MAG: SH3 domain-containing protein [Clostridiales bacterium]|jgi:hypothetical protein|nr:SH3 domain-containing protein [Clostridiales bacterium]